MDLLQAVAKTKAYGGYFHFPLTKEETHFWLISPNRVAKEAVYRVVSPLKPKENKQKETLLKNTLQKEIHARELTKYLWFFPSISLIALTGSVAANNTKASDDIDLLIITNKNTLWLTRPLFLLFLTLRFKRRLPGDKSSCVRNSFCPNLWLDSSKLAVPVDRRNIYTAHEVLQIRPLLDRGQTYLSFIKENRWTKNYLANAYQSLSRGRVRSTKQPLWTVFASPFNLFFFLLQYLYMSTKITVEKVSLHSAYFHKNDLSTSLADHLTNNSL